MCRPALVPIQAHVCTMGTGGCSAGLKRLGRKADHLPPFCDEDKNGGAISPFPNKSSGHSA